MIAIRESALENFASPCVGVPVEPEEVVVGSDKLYDGKRRHQKSGDSHKF